MVSIFDASDRELEGHRLRAKALAVDVRKGSFNSSGFSGGSALPSSVSAGAPVLSDISGDSEARSIRQYAAYKDVVFTAIRPIAVKFSNQQVRVGYDGTHQEISAFKSKALVPDFEIAEQVDFDFFKAKHFAPKFVQKYIGKNLTPLEDHPFLKLLGSPNEMLTQCGLMMLTALSFELTGRVAWWFDSTGSYREETGSSERLWYVPWHWLKPTGPKENKYATWELKKPGMSKGVPIDGKDIFYATNPNPADPTGCISTIQQIAKAVDTDERVQQAQHAGMENFINPKLAVITGRMPTLPGQKGPGPKAMINKEDRQKLIDAVKGHYQGVFKNGEPMILDALIEDVKQITGKPAELDLVNSSAVTQNRIMQGIGTSPVVAGYAENANRAGSNTAHEIFYEITLNPLINLIGQAMDAKIGPRYSSGKRLRIWIDEAKAHDADLLQSRVAMVLPALMVEESLEYAATGELNLRKRDEASGKMLMSEIMNPVQVQNDDPNNPAKKPGTDSGRPGKTPKEQTA